MRINKQIRFHGLLGKFCGATLVSRKLGAIELRPTKNHVVCLLDTKYITVSWDERYVSWKMEIMRHLGEPMEWRQERNDSNQPPSKQLKVSPWSVRWILTALLLLSSDKETKWTSARGNQEQISRNRKHLGRHKTEIINFSKVFKIDEVQAMESNMEESFLRTGVLTTVFQQFAIVLPHKHLLDNSDNMEDRVAVHSSRITGLRPSGSQKFRSLEKPFHCNHLG